MNFLKRIVTLLQEHQIAFELQEEKKGVNFPLLQLDENISLHVINIDRLAYHSIHENFFGDLSDAAERQGQQMIHLWEDVWLQHTEIASARLMAMLGIRKRIHARQTQLMRIDKAAAAAFLNRNHLQHDTTAYYKYALLKSEEIVAVATFSKSRRMTDLSAPYRSYELLRFASKAGFTITGGLGKLLAHFEEEINPPHLMTYSDRDWSVGKSYRKLGFIFDGNTKPQAFFLDPLKLQRYPQTRMMHDEKEMIPPGRIKIYNAGSGRWVRFREGFKEYNGSAKTA